MHTSKKKNVESGEQKTTPAYWNNNYYILSTEHNKNVFSVLFQINMYIYDTRIGIIMRDTYILSFYLLIPIISFETDEVSAIAKSIRDDITI